LVLVGFSGILEVFVIQAGIGWAFQNYKALKFYMFDTLEIQEMR
jgi:hypothetical protein